MGSEEVVDRQLAITNTCCDPRTLGIHHQTGHLRPQPSQLKGLLRLCRGTRQLLGLCRLGHTGEIDGFVHLRVQVETNAACAAVPLACHAVPLPTLRHLQQLVVVGFVGLQRFKAFIFIPPSTFLPSKGRFSFSGQTLHQATLGLHLLHGTSRDLVVQGVEHGCSLHCGDEAFPFKVQMGILNLTGFSLFAHHFVSAMDLPASGARAFVTSSIHRSTGVQLLPSVCLLCPFQIQRCFLFVLRQAVTGARDRGATGQAAHRRQLSDLLPNLRDTIGPLFARALLLRSHAANQILDHEITIAPDIQQFEELSSFQTCQCFHILTNLPSKELL
mmetsp:Transcript_21685/g.47488  ORF Transcript_21685/g.47488 Transcript_21685/m.47488 type:complete len:330 (+) Transcript_21685:1065-2054(+)